MRIQSTSIYALALIGPIAWRARPSANYEGMQYEVPGRTKSGYAPWNEMERFP